MDKEKQLVWTILSTPNDIDFKKFRKENNDFWLNQKREILWIPSMETSHIISCINMLERCGQIDTKAYEGLIEELRKRGQENEN